MLMDFCQMVKLAETYQYTPCWNQCQMCVVFNPIFNSFTYVVTC
jgi:hypothetical protein